MGFEKQILRAGTGPKPVKGQKVTVHCTGYYTVRSFPSSHRPLIYYVVLGSTSLQGLELDAYRSTSCSSLDE